MSSYILFIKDLRARTEDLGKGFLSEASKQWQALADSEKQKYAMQAQDMKETY